MTGNSPRRPTTRGAALVALAVAAACARGADRDAARDSAGATPAPAARAEAAPGVVPGAPATSCPHDGLWRRCSVAQRLDQAGLAPRPDTAARTPVPFLAVPDTAFRVALGTVRAFVYTDTARLTRDLASLDTVAVAPRGEDYDWPVRPTFVRSANLVAVILVTNERQLERVQLALEAGPPRRNPDVP